MLFVIETSTIIVINSETINILIRHFGRKILININI